MAVTFYLYLFAIGLLLLARLFIRPSNGGPSINQDDQPTTLSRRGAFIPYIFGRAITEPGFGWADDVGRYSRQEAIGGASGGKGKGGGGGGSIGQTVWFSAGWHQIATGPRTALRGIYEGGKKVWPPEGDPGITRTSAPSGTIINAGQVGTFAIYWGEFDQPVDSVLQTKMGIGSRWPGLCHIVWRDKRLGSSQAWPVLKYETEGDIKCVDALADPYIMDDGEGARGVNGMHAVLQILTGKFPYGFGLSAEEVDRVSAETASSVVIDEHLAVNFVIRDGENGEKTLQGIFTDLGMMMPIFGPKLMFMMMRQNVSDVPVLSNDVLMSPNLEIIVPTDEKDFDRVVFTYKDQDYAYRDNDIAFSNDGVADEKRRYKEVTISLATPTHVRVATTIANRRIQEPFGDDGTIKIKAVRGASLLLPGQAFNLPEVGPVRVFSSVPDTFTAACTIECILDSYGIAPDLNIIDTGNQNAGDSGGTPLGAEQDIAFTFIELPEALSGGMLRIVVARIRAHSGITGANIWVSADGASYVSLGQQTGACGGGIIEDALPPSDEDTIEDGPTFEVYGPDIGTIRDLTSDVAGWSSGSQIAIINKEVFFLRNITAVSEDDWDPSHIYAVGDSVIPTAVFGVTGFRYVCVDPGTSAGAEPSWSRVAGESTVDNGVVWRTAGYRYETHGLKRARYGTVKGDHEAGAFIFICNPNILTPMSSPLLVPGVDICMKTQPYTPAVATTISGADAVCDTITGIGTGKTYWVDDEAELLIDSDDDRFFFKD